MKLKKVKAAVVLALFCSGVLNSAEKSSSPNECDARAEKILRQMTLDEKIDYIGGYSSFYVRGIPRLGVPELKMADGPVGVRNSGPSTSYPAGICMAASWDPALAEKIGTMLGKDSRARGVHFLLAPGMNIYRAPMCGRNFEYFGEDPFLTSKIAVGIIKGIQSQGVIATAKHYACNNQEWNRYQVSSDIDERTLREIYLPAFEAAVKEAHVGAIMNSYNLLNGVYAPHNGHLNLDIAKKEWGFPGIIMSDWTSVYDGIAAANNGLDIEMPYGKYMNRQTLLPAIQNGQVALATIDDKVRRILRTAIAFGFFERPQTDATQPLFNQESRTIALKAAQDGMVLLKNNGLLPLDKSKLKSIAIIGPRAEQTIPQGGGSSKITPIIRTSFLAGISEAVDDKTKIFYARGTPDLATAFDWHSFKLPDISVPSVWNRFTPSLESKETGFLAEYFDNIDLQGAPALTRIDPRVRFWWAEGSYRKDGPVNHYSARWTSYFTPITTGEATFYVSGNDGFRLYVDDKQVLSHWHDNGESLQWTTLSLVEGKTYKIRLEYYVDHGGQKIDFGITNEPNTYLAEAKTAAANAEAVILCVGFDGTDESEFLDRPFKLPEAQNELIKTVLAANKNTVIVMTAGGNVDMSSWIDEAQALLYAWYPGQEGGAACAQILFGDINPSGKLPASFERTLTDNAAFNNYYDTNDSKHITYKEGIFLGYRHFDRSSIKPLFPFGHGLSYTTFKYSNLKVTPAVIQGIEGICKSLLEAW